MTIQHKGLLLLCFVGDHGDCDRWLDNNKGLTPIADQYGRLAVAYSSSTLPDNESLPAPHNALAPGKLYLDLKKDNLFDALVEGLPGLVVRHLKDVESITSHEEMIEILDLIGDTKQRSAISDVFTLLTQGKMEEAITRTLLYLGRVQPAVVLTREEILALADSDAIQSLKANDPRFPLVFDHFVKSATYMDWMLFLHPDQQNVVDIDFAGPAKLVGVSGSGKTCIVVKRAVRLAERYPGQKILVLTLNRQLAHFIGEMVDAVCPTDLRSFVVVKPFFELCQSLLHDFEPENGKLYDDVTWKSKEHIDEIWREFYRCELNNHDAEVLLPLHDSLMSRTVFAEQYIREEFDWIRSALSQNERPNYMDFERKGRSYPLDARFRAILLEGLNYWEGKMRAVGVTDYLGLSTAIHKYLDDVHAAYRCVLIDESQDFGTIEYKIIRRLCNSAENDLFICGDAAQQVSTKQRTLRSAGIEIHPSRSLTIHKNYRNSREILKAAFEILVSNLSDELLDSEDFELLEPQHANFRSAPPVLLHAISLEHEIALAFSYMRQKCIDEPHRKHCIAFCGYSLYQIQCFARSLNITVLDGSSSILSDPLYISDLEHTKGFEFDTVLLVNAREGVLPDPNEPEKEQFRDLARFYVAMTRAKSELIISYSGLPSSFLKECESYVVAAPWAEYSPDHEVAPMKPPPTLDNIRDLDTSACVDLSEMSGPQFLYTAEAVGLDSSLIAKIRELIPGRTVTRGRTRIKWRSLADAIHDLESDAGARQIFGVDAIAFRDLVSRLRVVHEK